jgi:two-component sensor histidine kinase
MARLAWGPFTTIRSRLGAAVALALLPVLLIGAVQATIAFRKDAEEQHAGLALAAVRSAATARTELAGASVLLETLGPQSIGLDCTRRLGEISGRLGGYENLIRFDSQGRVTCAAANVPADPARRSSDWFVRLAQGAPSVAVRAPKSLSGLEPALLAAERVAAPDGSFDGAMAAVVNLRSLQPDLSDPSLPPGTAVALVDDRGRFLSRTDTGAFPASVAPSRGGLGSDGAVIDYGPDVSGQRRVYSMAPLIGDVSVLLSAPAQGWFSWARLNLLSGVLLPLLAFLTALIAVLVVTERVVVRWLHYLQRIADIYAKGRFTVRPLQASRAPPEIRELAHALDVMADAVTARDGQVAASLAEKDELMREIHHRVRNNLQVISSLLSMQQRALGDPVARDAIFDTRQRINALALIYRALYQGADFKRVDIRQFLADLLAQLVVEHQEHGEVIATELEADALIIDPDKLAPLALFAVEAITNAQKHALAVRGGVLRVRFQVTGDDAELAIIDEGCGATPELAKAGVGRQLMTAFARQLRGRMEVVANSGGGVTASLVFPTPKARSAGGQGDAGRRSRGNRAAA